MEPGGQGQMLTDVAKNVKKTKLAPVSLGNGMDNTVTPTLHSLSSLMIQHLLLELLVCLYCAM